MKMISSCDFCKQPTDFKSSTILRMVNLVDGYLNNRFILCDKCAYEIVNKNKKGEPIFINDKKE